MEALENIGGVLQIEQVLLGAHIERRGHTEHAELHRIY